MGVPDAGVGCGAGSIGGCGRAPPLGSSPADASVPSADNGHPSPAVKEKLRLDPDSEIATTGVRVSLICPVSRGARVLSPRPPRGGAAPGRVACSPRRPPPRSW